MRKTKPRISTIEEYAEAITAKIVNNSEELMIPWSELTRYVPLVIRLCEAYPISGDSKKLICITVFNILKIRHVREEEHEQAQFYINIQLSDQIDEIILMAHAKEFARRGFLLCC